MSINVQYSRLSNTSNARIIPWKSKKELSNPDISFLDLPFFEYFEI